MAHHETQPAQHREAPRRDKAPRTPESPEHLLTAEELERDAQQILDRAMESAQQAVRRQEKRLMDGLEEAGIEPGSADSQEALDTFRGSNTLDEFRRRFGAFGKWLMGIGMAASLERSTPESPDVGTFEHHEEAAKQMAQEGITDERREAYTPGVSESVYRVITPLGDLDNFSDILLAIPKNILEFRDVPDETGLELEKARQLMQQRNDAYRLYLGLPQEHDTLGVSDYQPSGSTQDKYYYKVNGWLEQFAYNQDLPETDQSAILKHIVVAVGQDPKLRKTYQQEMENQRASKFEEESRINTTIQDRILRITSDFKQTHPGSTTSWDKETYEAYKRKIDTDPEVMQLRNRLLESLLKRDLSFSTSPSWVVSSGNKSVIVAGDPVMGHYKLSVGHDAKGEYLSYYDVWDYGQPGQSGKGLVELTEGFIGKPYELYDRIYFDRDTWTVQAGS